MATMPEASIAARAPAAGRVRDRLAGLLLMSTAPALFWMAVAHVAAGSLGYTLGPLALAGIGTSVFVVLFGGCAAVACAD